MSASLMTSLPLSESAPKLVSEDPPLQTAWESINAWFQNLVETGGDADAFSSNAAFIMMACKFINLRVKKLLDDKVKEGSAELWKNQAGLIVRQMKKVSAELLKNQAVAEWLGQDSSLKASVKVGTMLFNALYQQGSQFAQGQPLPQKALLSVRRVWNMISLINEIAPHPETVKSREIKDRLAWLEKQSGNSLKRPLGQDAENEDKGKKTKTAASQVMQRIEVMDVGDLEIIKRYDINIGIVPIEGPVKNRSVVTAHDVSSLAQGAEVNDTAIDAHLTLVCHAFNGLFQEGAQLPRSPKYHSWSTHMSIYLSGRQEHFEEKHLRQEWPPARFPNAALEDVPVHIFPIHVSGNAGGGHWILMVLQREQDGQWSLFCYSSLPGYQGDFAVPWQVISSWLFFKSKGALDVKHPRVKSDQTQPMQNNDRDCGVFVCGIVRWSLEGWDLNTLTPSIIPAYRRRMMLELEQWSLSTNTP